MKVFCIHFLNEDRTISASGGTLMQAMISAGIAVDAACGGHGGCGRCTVEVRRPGSGWEKLRACRTEIDSDMEIRTPDAEKLQLLTEGAASEVSWNPWAQAVEVQLPRAVKGENLSDWDRLCFALGNAAAWQPNPEIAGQISAIERETAGKFWAVVGEDLVLAVSPENPRPCMAAFDLGTTSIAGFLIRDGKIIARLGMGNPQAKFGADVISRAEYALNHGASDLSVCLRQAVDELLGRLCEAAGVERSTVYALSVAGNTCMHHLFLDISPASLVRAPYNPAIRSQMRFFARDFGIHAHPGAEMLVLPVIAGFVGADTVACLLAGDWEKREKCTLLIDIGTNGELVLGNRSRMVACSTAAGPAFEGAKIEYGMRGADGAIDRVWLENGEIRWHVIGGGTAKGICGSGLVDLAASLLECGACDGGGRLENGSFAIGDTGISLSQKDVRELQLAKAAIAAGIEMLAQEMGISISEIEEVHIAGAFGNALKPENACKIGLIPEELLGRIRSVGNAAGVGCCRALMNRDFWHASQRLADRAGFLELATLPDFQDAFVDALAFYEE